MGFGAYAAQAGVQDYYSREDYEKRCGTDDFDGYWGIWDEPFLQYMSRVLSETPQPFFASAFTLSSHHPFVVRKNTPRRCRKEKPRYTKAWRTPTSHCAVSWRPRAGNRGTKIRFSSS